MKLFGTQIRAWRNIGRGDLIEIMIERHDQDGTRKVIQETQDGLAMTELQPFDYARPSLDLLPEAAQSLMDDLWRAGLRPAAGRQSEGVITAQAKHLEDMRAIVFDKLKVEPPQ